MEWNLLSNSWVMHVRSAECQAQEGCHARSFPKPLFLRSALCGAAGARPLHFAPYPKRMHGTVLTRIFKSTQSDQLSMYSRSRFTQSSKSVI